MLTLGTCSVWSREIGDPCTDLSICSDLSVRSGTLFMYTYIMMLYCYGNKITFVSQLIYFTLSLSSPFRKRRDPSFEQTCIPFTQGYFIPSLVKIDRVILEKTLKVYNNDVDNNNNDDDDNGQLAHLNPRLWWMSTTFLCLCPKSLAIVFSHSRSRYFVLCM